METMKTATSVAFVKNTKSKTTVVMLTDIEKKRLPARLERKICPVEESGVNNYSDQS